MGTVFQLGAMRVFWTLFVVMAAPLQTIKEVCLM